MALKKERPRPALDDVDRAGRSPWLGSSPSKPDHAGKSGGEQEQRRRLRHRLDEAIKENSLVDTIPRVAQPSVDGADRDDVRLQECY